MWPQVTTREWGEGLIRSWNSAGWIDLAARAGDKIAALVGARPGEVSVGDSTSLNLFKALSAAVDDAARADAHRSARSCSRSAATFPTDLYIAESIVASAGMKLVLVGGDDVVEHLTRDVAVLMLTHVNYRSGRMHRLREVTRAAHAAGALVVWDLAHSAGAVPVDLHGADADFAVGCGYKYLNGGPGAPAFVWAHPRHTERMDREQMRQPLSGWLGHAAPFEFASSYRPATGIQRFVCGTPPVLSLAALDCGLDVFGAAEVSAAAWLALRDKSIALTELFIARVEARCAGHGLALVSPRDFGSARQPGQLRPCRRLSGDAGADRARRDRRLPRRRGARRRHGRRPGAARPSASLRLHAALHAPCRRMGRRRAAGRRAAQRRSGATRASIGGRR